MKPDLYLINGPLGAGKTTFLKELLKIPQYKDARIIENEFANTSVDTEQLHNHHAEVRTIAGVCICCSTGDELTDALGVLSGGSTPVIIEATGVANSLRLIEKIVNADMLDLYTIRHAIFILDAIEAIDNVEGTLDTYRHELQAADTVLVSKTDLLRSNQVERLMDALSQLDLQQVSFANDGVFDASLLEAESKILDHFANLDEHVDNHEDGAGYTVIDISSVELDAPQIQSVWEEIQLAYGLRRMKGNIQSKDGIIRHIEATPRQCRVSPYEFGELKLVVIGKEATKVTLELVLGMVNRG